MFQVIKKNFWVAITLAFGVSVWTSALLAGDVVVRVHDEVSGKLMAGVSVCVGSGANPSQFGAARSDVLGEVTFADVPRASLLLTASARGYNGLQRQFLGQANKLVQIIHLQAGNRSGPRCHVRVAERSNPSLLQISSFLINDGSASTPIRSVSLVVHNRGHASQYRVSENHDFQGAKWIDYPAAVQYELSGGAGLKDVFFQLRRVLSAEGAKLQISSNIVSDTIRLVPPSE